MVTPTSWITTVPSSVNISVLSYCYLTSSLLSEGCIGDCCLVACTQTLVAFNCGVSKALKLQCHQKWSERLKNSLGTCPKTSSLKSSSLCVELWQCSNKATHFLVGLALYGSHMYEYHMVLGDLLLALLLQLFSPTFVVPHSAGWGPLLALIMQLCINLFRHSHACARLPNKEWNWASSLMLVGFLGIQYSLTLATK